MISKEKTLVIIKPDGVQRTLIGEIIKRLERVGLKLVAIKMIVPSVEQIKKHYTIDPLWPKKVGEKNIKSIIERGGDATGLVPEDLGNKVLDKLVNYLSSGPVVSMVWQGAHSVSVVRKVVGGTEPRTSDVGTIRGDFVLDSYEMADGDNRSVRNLIHASSSVEEAEQEVPIWFSDSEIIDYRLVQEQILYDVNLDGILE